MAVGEIVPESEDVARSRVVYVDRNGRLVVKERLLKGGRTLYEIERSGGG